MRATNYFAAIAARFLFMLGANLGNPPQGSQSIRAGKRHRSLRNLFWICYTLDKDICLRTGRLFTSIFPSILAPNFDDNPSFIRPTTYNRRRAL